MKKNRNSIAAIILFISVLLSGCGADVVEQKNNSLSFYFISNENDLWYRAAEENLLQTYPDITITRNWWPVTQYLMLSSRQYKDTDITPLQEYYDRITNDLRKGQAGDIVMGDAIYLEWPEAVPPDWYKLMQSGAFADLNPLAEENGQLDTTTYMKGNSADAIASDERWTFVPILDSSLVFFTNEELVEQWAFPLPQATQEDYPNALSMNIITFLEQCADWVEKYGDDPDAPSIMPDFRFRVLKSLVFDVCGLTIADYQTGKVDFDNPTVKRIVEAIRTISSDIEESGLGDQGILEFEVNASRENRYFLYGEGISTDGVRKDSMISLSLTDMNNQYCDYAIRWVAILASSKNQEIAYAYIQALLAEDVVNSGYSWNLVSEYKKYPEQYRDPHTEVFNIVVPSIWQYALSDLFDNYYAGNMETDQFMDQVQSRLQVYITE